MLGIPLIGDFLLLFYISALGHDEKCVKNSMSLMVILRGRRWFLIRYLEDRVIHDIRGHLNMWILTCAPDLSSLYWWEVCQEPPLLWSYLEDVWGSWPGTSRTGSWMTSWINLEDPQKVILKVSCQYLLIWLSFGEVKMCNCVLHTSFRIFQKQTNLKKLAKFIYLPNKYVFWVSLFQHFESEVSDEQNWQHFM